jgi:predicted GNAT family acetyltransferase
MDSTPVKNDLMQRFELQIEGKTAFLEYKPQGADVLAFTHTYVPPELRGRNLAAILTRFALDDARRQGKKVAPLCSYVATYMERHKDCKDFKASLPIL